MNGVCNYTKRHIIMVSRGRNGELDVISLQMDHLHRREKNDII